MPDPVQRFNEAHPVGTPVLYWPGAREGAWPGRESVTRSQARLLCGTPCVWVEGYPGGIALTHVEVRRDASACATPRPAGWYLAPKEDDGT
jgi:hypothetical protein